MAEDRTSQGGPAYNRKDAPVPDADQHRHARSRDELMERSAHGERPGRGRRNGSDKAPRG